MSKKRYFIFDTETGGLPEQIPIPTLLTLYGIVIDENFNNLGEIDLKIKPKHGIYHVNPKAIEINKIDLVQHNKDADEYAEAALDLYHFLEKHKLQEEQIVPVGQNINFDIFFVKELLSSLGSFNEQIWNTYCSRRPLDISSIAQFLILKGKLPIDLIPSLKNLCEYFELDYNGAHNAKFDTHATIGVLHKLLQLTGE